MGLVEIWRTLFKTQAFRRTCSAEFKEGMLAAIDNLENLGMLGYRMKKCPYKTGTASCDAWFAGVREGKKVWHIRQAIGRRKMAHGAGESIGCQTVEHMEGI